MRALAALSVVFLLAGALTSTAVAATPDTKKMVLKLADLPAGFALDKGYYADNARAAKETQTLAGFTRWGGMTGYEAHFSREAINLFVTSASSVYKTSKGAADSTRDSYSVEGKTQRLDGQPVVFKRVSTRAKIGQEARMFSATLKYRGVTLIIYAVVWRYRVVKASVYVVGLSGTVKATQAVQLAQKQQARIEAAIS